MCISIINLSFIRGFFAMGFLVVKREVLSVKCGGLERYQRLRQLMHRCRGSKWREKLCLKQAEPKVRRMGK